VVVFQDENKENIKTIQVKLVSQELLHFGMTHDFSGSPDLFWEPLINNNE
jgi:hypothetical protein